MNKYPRPHYRNRHLNEIVKRRLRERRLKDLTYIFGSRHENGVTLVSDRRMIRGYEFAEEDKLIKISDDLVVGASGTTALFDKFVNKLHELRMVNIKNAKNYYKILNYIEGTVPSINKRFEGAVGEDGYIELLIGIKNPTTKKSELWHVQPNGLSEKVKSSWVIGSGAPYGKFFDVLVSNLLKEMEEHFEKAVARGILPIMAIERYKLTSSVGGKPQICLMDDGDNPVILNIETDPRAKEIFKEVFEKMNQLLDKFEEALRFTS